MTTANTTIAIQCEYPVLNHKYIGHIIYCIFWIIRHTFPPNLGGNGGASYSPNVAYIYIGEILCYLCY